MKSNSKPIISFKHRKLPLHMRITSAMLAYIYSFIAFIPTGYVISAPAPVNIETVPKKVTQTPKHTPSKLAQSVEKLDKALKTAAKSETTNSAQSDSADNDSVSDATAKLLESLAAKRKELVEANASSKILEKHDEFVKKLQQKINDA